jgi:hypothetical protein
MDKHTSVLTSEQRSGRATAFAFARIFIGVFWIFEVTVGHNWKLGGFGSGANPGWVGPGAGDSVRESIASAVDDGTWAWVAWLYQTVIEPNAAAFSYFIVILQVALGLFFIVGFAVRPLALFAIVVDLSIFFLGNSRIPPFFTIAHLFLLYSGAGRYYGLDGWLLGRLQGARGGGARAVRWLLDLPLLRRNAVLVMVMSGSVLLAGYFLMQVAMRETFRMNLVSMELAVLFGLVAAGIYFGRRTPDHLSVVVALLRVFIGYKLLHEIWVRVQPGVNGLPGWADTGSQRELFETISANHWALFAWLVDNAVLPAMAMWVIIFGVVQFAVGAALVLGYRTRLAATIGLVYLGGLGVLGFTRYAPFVFGLLVVVLVLDGGRGLGLDARRLADQPARYRLPVPRLVIPALVVLAAVNGVAAAVAVVATGGIAPGGYVASMGQMTTAMVAIFSLLFALGGWAQLRAEKRAVRAGASGAGDQETGHVPAPASSPDERQEHATGTSATRMSPGAAAG